MAPCFNRERQLQPCGTADSLEEAQNCQRGWLHIPLRDCSLCFIHSTREVHRDWGTWVNQRAVAPQNTEAQESHWTNIPNLLCQSWPCWMSLIWLSATPWKKIGQAEGEKGRESGIHLSICVTVLKSFFLLVLLCLLFCFVFPSTKSVGFCCLTINSIVPFKNKKKIFAFGKVKQNKTKRLIRAVGKPKRNQKKKKMRSELY